MRVHVIINRSSGRRRATDVGAPREIRSMLGDHGIEGAVELVEPRRFRSAVRAALGRPVDAVLVGGGDGSASTAAGVMVEDGRPLGLLPIGTRNHFARDLGMPPGLEPAVACIATGQVRVIDVGDVNGHTFINNSSLGLYPDIVLLRELDRGVTGSGRWSAFARAAWRATQNPSPVDVEITCADTALARRTSFLLVGNNRYELGLPELWRRPRLDRGELSLYVAGELGRLDLVRLGLATALGTMSEAELEVFAARSVSVQARQGRLRVSLDGEVVRLAPPLRYRSRPGALRVFAPEPAIGVARPPDAGPEVGSARDSG
jgi:diacylglycerol kinase family enzyme